MLPSASIERLCRRVPLVGLRRAAEACAQLRQEFLINCLNSWVVILDGKGETLDSYVGDAAGRGCRNGDVGGFPDLFARRIEAGLRRKRSAQEFKRRWEKARTKRAFESLLRRLTAMSMFLQLAAVCERGASDASMPRKMRVDLAVRGFLARCHGWYPPEQQRKLVAYGERILTKYPRHPLATDVVNGMFNLGLAKAFDVRAKTEACIERLSAAAAAAPDSGALERHIGVLRGLCSKSLAEAKERIAALDHLSEEEVPADARMDMRGRWAVMVGDANGVIAAFSKPPHDTHPLYEGWLAEARQMA